MPVMRHVDKSRAVRVLIDPQVILWDPPDHCTAKKIHVRYIAYHFFMIDTRYRPPFSRPMDAMTFINT
jgi:hypothetical protein